MLKKIILLFLAFYGTIQAQNKNIVITGTVSQAFSGDSTKRLVGATVYNAMYDFKTTTDSAGKFSFDVSKKYKHLPFRFYLYASYPNLQTEKINIYIKKIETPLTFILHENNKVKLKNSTKKLKPYTQKSKTIKKLK